MTLRYMYMSICRSTGRQQLEYGMAHAYGTCDTCSDANYFAKDRKHSNQTNLPQQLCLRGGPVQCELGWHHC